MAPLSLSLSDIKAFVNICMQIILLFFLCKILILLLAAQKEYEAVRIKQRRPSHVCLLAKARLVESFGALFVLVSLP